MKQETRDIQKWVKQKYGNKYDVSAEIDNQNKLSDGMGGWYQPDVLLLDKNTKQIVYIVEIEGDPVRKALVGASILADNSAYLLNKHHSPKLIFVVWAKKGLIQIDNFIAKSKIARKYCTHLKNIEIYSVDDFKALEL